jgi:hypothetical protein
MGILTSRLRILIQDFIALMELRPTYLLDDATMRRCDDATMRRCDEVWA